MEPGVERSVKYEIGAVDKLHPHGSDSDVTNVRPRDLPPSEADLRYLIQSAGLKRLDATQSENGQSPETATSSQAGITKPELEIARLYMVGIRDLIISASQLGSTREIHINAEHLFPDPNQARSVLSARNYAQAALAACGIRIYWAMIGDKQDGRQIQFDELMVSWPDSLEIAET